MNIQNIKSLQGQLATLGFEQLVNELPKRICFKADSFISFLETLKGRDRLNFYLYFIKDKDTYALMYYDASILKEISFEHATINDVDTASLEKRMSSIDWASTVNPRTSEIQIKAGIENWEIETLIEAVVEDLHKLEEDEAGNKIALKLKQKYWAGIPLLEQIGNISPTSNKQEVSQRFYFYPGQIGISVDEAHRFLQNMMIEKQLQLAKKQDRNVAATVNDKVKIPVIKKAAIRKHPGNPATIKIKL